jgi:putative CocE/NonD family hydrolase
MRRFMRAGVLAAALSQLAAFAVTTAPASILHVPVFMRDGERLCTNIFLPFAPGRFPTLLVRTPYGKGLILSPVYESFLKSGYALVVQDVRGRHHSSGTFQPLSQETPDGEDTLNWIASQSWSDGNIGMFGGSYLGIVQWRVAPLRNPHLKAIFPIVAGGDEYLDRFYSPGGAMKFGHRLLWIAENLRVRGFRAPDFSSFVRHIPLRTADLAASGEKVEFFQRALDHPTYDSFWRSVSTREKLDRITVPAFIVGGWYDNFVESDLRAFSALSKHSVNYRVMIGPWAHAIGYKFSGVDFGPDALVPIRTYQLAWFDRWLKAKAVPATVTQEAPVRIFVMGANRWRGEQTWPLERAQLTPMYLWSGGEANGSSGDGTLSWKPPRRDHSVDQFVYDPSNPVPTNGGSVCCNPKVFPWGPTDQRSLEKRQDVLVYTSDPFLDDLEVTGPIEGVLHVATTAEDTDFTAKLVDVAPDGYARNLCDGILRLRYRNGLQKGVLAKPGEVYRIAIDAGVTSNVLLSGHRIRVEISSSNFPRCDRNPNTGRPVAAETEFRKANQTVFHDRNRPSFVVLPVIPSEHRRSRKIDSGTSHALLSNKKSFPSAR